MSVFLHGGPGLNTHAERVLLGDQLSARMKVMWVDQLGGGESVPRSMDAIGWDPLVEDMLTIIRKEGGGPVRLLAHCAGSHVSHEIVSRDPSLVSEVVFINPSENLAATLKNIIRNALSEKRLETAPEELARIKSMLEKDDSSFGLEQVLTFVEFVVKVRGLPELYWFNRTAMAEVLPVAAQQPISPQAFVALLVQILARPKPNYGAYSKTPVRIIHGDMDRVSPWEENGAVLVKAIPHAKVERLPGVGHWPQFEARERFLELV
jgi:pimeloyl-ACP methyl ester carboxylesterase